METSRIPFRIPKVYAGCAKMEGFLAVCTDRLLFEYRMTDNLIGLLSSGITQRVVRYEKLERAAYRLSFFRLWLTFSANALDAFEQLPHSDPMRLEVCIPWRCWTKLSSVVAEINMGIQFQDAGRRLKELDDERARWLRG